MGFFLGGDADGRGALRTGSRDGRVGKLVAAHDGFSWILDYIMLIDG